MYLVQSLYTPIEVLLVSSHQLLVPTSSRAHEGQDAMVGLLDANVGAVTTKVRRGTHTVRGHDDSDETR